MADLAMTELLKNIHAQDDERVKHMDEIDAALARRAAMLADGIVKHYFGNGGTSSISAEGSMTADLSRVLEVRAQLAQARESAAPEPSIRRL